LLSGRAASFFAGCGVVFDAFAPRFVVAVVAFALPMGWAPRAFFVVVFASFATVVAS